MVDFITDFFTRLIYQYIVVSMLYVVIRTNQFLEDSFINKIIHSHYIESGINYICLLYTP